jgi:hypothetical protein
MGMNIYPGFLMSAMLTTAIVSTSFAQSGGQENYSPVTLPASTQGQPVNPLAVFGTQHRTAAVLQSVVQSQPITNIAPLPPQAEPQTIDAAASASTTTPPKSATVDPKILDPIIGEQQDANETASSGSSFSQLFSNNDGADSAALPDAPTPQDQTQAPQQPPAYGTHTNPLPVLPPRLTSVPLDAHDKLVIYVHKSFGPAAVIFPAFVAGFDMINPKSAYPKEWKDGAGAFGRWYGDALARQTSRSTAEFMTDTILHEDPRYLRSDSTNAFGRTLHALAFTAFDKTDSGKTTLAVSHFAGAAAGGFVGMAYLPAGYNDVTHAEQRMAVGMAGVAVGNIFTEFEPEWGPLYRKLHIPKVLPPWWVPDHR